MIIASLSPTHGPVGTQVTISGSGFGSSQGRNTVAFNGTPAKPAASWNDTRIVGSVPHGATEGPVVVQVVQVVDGKDQGVEESAGKFTVTPWDATIPAIEDRVAALDARVAALEARSTTLPSPLPRRDPVTGLDIVPIASATKV